MALRHGAANFAEGKLTRTGRPLKHGEPLAGKLIRLPLDLWDVVLKKAKAEGISLNDAMIAAARKWTGRKK